MRSNVRYLMIWAVVAAVLIGVAAGAYAGQGLSPGQKDKLKALAADTRDRTERARDDLRRARMDLADVFSSYQLDLRKAKAVQDRVSKAQMDLLKAHLDNQIQIRQVLNAEQFEQFNEMLSRRMPGGQMGGFHHIEPGPDWFPDGRILRDMDLTPDQMKRLRSVKEPERRKVFEKLENDSRQMIQMYQRYDLDANAARKLVESIHSTQQDLAALNLKSQQALRAVLTQAQFEKYRDTMAEKIRSRMREHKWPRDRMRKPPQ